MKTSQLGRSFIESFEKLRLSVYNDEAGKATVGFGHLVKEGESFTTITEEQADILLGDDLAWAESVVNDHVHADLSQNQFDALVSLVFNIGSGNFENSTLLRLINAGNPEAAAQQFIRWDRTGGHESDGLKARRVAEQKIFLESVYENHN